MISSYAAYIAYMEQIVREHQGLRAFVYGNTERLLQLQNLEIDYPAMVLTFPDVTPVPGGNTFNMKVNAMLMVLTNAEANDATEENAALAVTYDLMQDVLRRLIYDAEEGRFNLDPTRAVIQPKVAYTGDDTHGWVLEFDIDIAWNECYVPGFGPYANDTEAAVGGVPGLETYRLREVNSYSLTSPGDRLIVVRLDGTAGTFALPGPYTNDAAAEAGGLMGSQLYRIAEVNDYNIPSPGGRTVVAAATTPRAEHDYIPGPYANDAAAEAGEVSVGAYYRIAETNDYNIPSPGGRSVVARIE